MREYTTQMDAAKKRNCYAGDEDRGRKRADGDRDFKEADGGRKSGNLCQQTPCLPESGGGGQHAADEGEC